jgi:hypothetical protein
MATYRPRLSGRPPAQKEAYPQGQSAARPAKYDVVSGPAPMRTTNAFHPLVKATPQIGLHLGFNK